jgi:predicted transcriptional regulator
LGDEIIEENNENSLIFDNKIAWSAQGLRNPIRLSIFQRLANKNNCSFNELRHYLNISRPKLAYHLQILMKNNIITNFYDKIDGVKDHSYYDLTTFGRELLSDLSSPIQMENPNSHTQENMINDDKNLEAFNNFRTINKIEYRSSKNLHIKRTNESYEMIKNNDRRYYDSLLECNIIIKTKPSSAKKKVDLPAMRKHYSQYRNPFNTKQKVEKKY